MRVTGDDHDINLGAWLCLDNLNQVTEKVYKLKKMHINKHIIQDIHTNIQNILVNNKFFYKKLKA